MIVLHHFARKHLDFSDLMTEAAAAVYMLVIINGYVQLSQLHTEFYYILAVDVGASVGWGLIDGFTYAIGQSISRGNDTIVVKRTQSADPEKALAAAQEGLDGTFVSGFSRDAKKAIAEEIVSKAPDAVVDKQGVFSREDLSGLVSILGVYLTAGLALSLPYVVFADKLIAWLVSNTIGIAWLFYFGYTVGRVTGQKRVLIGVLTSAVGIAFLALSYRVYA